MTIKTGILGHRRATELIVECSRQMHVHRKIVLLPALFCPEIAKLLEKTGIPFRCYDVGIDLGRNQERTLEEIDRVMGPDVGLVLTVHYFGLLCSLPKGSLHGISILEDACHAGRTLKSEKRNGVPTRPIVFSPRKEFSWSSGGILEGSVIYLKQSPNYLKIVDKWEQIVWSTKIDHGRKQTALAKAVLKDRLPEVGNAILTHIPLRSYNRDQVVESLRRQNINAWYWIRPLKGTTPQQTPRTWHLRKTLFAVTLCVGENSHRIIEVLSKTQLIDFGEQR